MQWRHFSQSLGLTSPLQVVACTNVTDITDRPPSSSCCEVETRSSAVAERLRVVKHFAKSLESQGHSRTFEMAPMTMSRACVVIPCRPKYVSILYRFRHIQRPILA